MPRQPRLDAPGTLHHVIGRGIERTKIFRGHPDREDFLARVGELCQKGAWSVFAWVLMDNHFHLLIRSGNQSLSKSMRKLLTGYVVNFNRRHNRYGHLFQNRYKSIVCEDDPYLLELSRYIHLNPLRAGVVKGLRELKDYPWCGHGVVLGRMKKEWQEVNSVLSYFGRKKKRAALEYEEYVGRGANLGKRPELVGGGLIRSLGGWSEVLSMRRRDQQMASDQRILGSGDFVEQVVSEARGGMKEALGGRARVPDLESLLRTISKKEGVDGDKVRRGGRKKKEVKVRKEFCRVAAKQFGYSGASIARYLGVTASLVNRYASLEESIDE